MDVEIVTKEALSQVIRFYESAMASQYMLMLGLYVWSHKNGGDVMFGLQITMLVICLMMFCLLIWQRKMLKTDIPIFWLVGIVVSITWGLLTNSNIERQLKECKNTTLHN